jgi:UV DNA damage repair endonuclease
VLIDSEAAATTTTTNELIEFCSKRFIFAKITKFGQVWQKLLKFNLTHLRQILCFFNAYTVDFYNFSSQKFEK